MDKLSQVKQYSNPNMVIAKGKRLGIDIHISNRKDKKYMVISPEGKKIHFGEMGYEDFTYHKDESRRMLFKQRNRAWANAPKWTARWMSYWILW